MTNDSSQQPCDAAAPRPPDGVDYRSGTTGVVTAAAPAPPQSYRPVPLHKIMVTSPTNGRAEIDEDHVTNLALLIARDGLLHPITVQAHAADDNYTLVAGLHRLLALKGLAWQAVPAFIVAHDHPCPERVRFCENLTRAELTPMEEAEAVAGLLKSNAGDIGRTAKDLRRTPNWVITRVDLLNLPTDVQSAIHEKKIRIAAGTWLGKITDDVARARLLHYAVQNGATSATTRLWYQDWLTGAVPGGSDAAYPAAAPLQRYTIDSAVDCYLCQSKTPIGETLAIRVCLECHDTVRHTALSKVETLQVP